MTKDVLVPSDPDERGENPRPTSGEFGIPPPVHSWGGAIKAALQAGSDGPRTSKEARRGIKAAADRARLKTANRLAKVHSLVSNPSGAAFGTF